MPPPAGRDEFQTVTKSRFQADAYVMKEDRYKYIHPIIITNWEICDAGDMYILMTNTRIPRQDVKNLKESLDTLYPGISQRCIQLENMTRPNLLNTLKSIASGIPTSGPKRPDMLMCFIVARGKKDFFYDLPVGREACKKIHFTEIMDIFNAENCPGLIMRPKLFIAQVEMKAHRRVGGEFVLHILPPPIPNKVIPMETDFMLYACNRISEEQKDEPSTFMKALCEELKKVTSPEDVLDVTVRVNKQISHHVGEEYLPYCTSQLTKVIQLKKMSPAAGEGTNPAEPMET